jgi:hypothetical protein
MRNSPREDNQLDGQAVADRLSGDGITVTYDGETGEFHCSGVPQSEMAAAVMEIINAPADDVNIILIAPKGRVPPYGANRGTTDDEGKPAIVIFLNPDRTVSVPLSVEGPNLLRNPFWLWQVILHEFLERVLKNHREAVRIVNLLRLLRGLPQRITLKHMHELPYVHICPCPPGCGCNQGSHPDPRGCDEPTCPGEVPMPGGLGIDPGNPHPGAPGRGNPFDDPGRNDLPRGLPVPGDDPSLPPELRPGDGGGWASFS